MHVCFQNLRLPRTPHKQASLVSQLARRSSHNVYKIGTRATPPLPLPWETRTGRALHTVQIPLLLLLCSIINVPRNLTPRPSFN